jgi:acyl-CoA thioester hydrolase
MTDGIGAGASAPDSVPGKSIPAPLQVHAATVRRQWVDYNDHLSEWAYLLIFGDNADALFRFIGIDEAYRATGRSLYTAETHLRHLREVKVGQRLVLTLIVLGHDAKRLHVLHEMLADGIGCVATAEQLLLHVESAAGSVVPFGAEIAGRLRQIAAAHAALGVPDYAARCMRIPER